MLLTEALSLLLLHEPPVIVLDNVSVVPVHTVEEPVIVPAFGSGLIVAEVVAKPVQPAPTETETE